MVGTVAALRVAAAVVLFLAGAYARSIEPPLPWLIYALLATCFCAVGLALIAVNKHDVRAVWLGGTLLLVAAPLVSPFFNGRPLDELGWVWFVRADVFLPALLWRFAAEFPSPLVGRPERIFILIGHAAGISGAWIAAVNLSFLVWAPANDWRWLFSPPTAAGGTLYYPIQYGFIAGAFAALIWRASRGRADEQRRLRLFAIGLAAGAAPLLIHVLLETMPRYYAFVHRPNVEQAVGGIVFGALAVIPFVTAYSVLFDQVVDTRIILRAALQYALAKYTIFVAAAMPFAALLLVIYRERAEPLVAFVSGARPLLLGGTALAGLVALRMHRRLIGMLDRRYFREPYDTRQLLDQVMSEVLHATSTAELQDRLQAAIGRAMHGDLTLFVVDVNGNVLARPDGSRPLAADGILAQLLAGDVTAMDVEPSDRRTPFRRLSTHEQEWVLHGGFVLLVPLHSQAARLVGVIALAAKRSGLHYSMEDRRMLSAVAASASLAIDNLRLRSTTSDASERAARECQSCSKVNGPDVTVCTCGGAVSVCAAPHTLRGIYRLDRRIGAGGMGVVYLAHDMSLDRPVAIKTLPSVSPEQSARLRAEARAMAAAPHPNLAVIHGIETWQGIPFLVEEFLAGGTLADRLRAGPLPVGDAARLCLTIAGALDHLHTAGIVHRDVKPSNVGFTDREVPKLLDFGLAKVPRPPDPSADTTISQVVAGRVAAFGDTAVFGGTPAYMAPEALDGMALARPALDVWALGVVLFECVAGRRPFLGGTREEIKANARLGLRQPPSALNDRCPRQLDVLMEAWLHSEPSKRPASAAEVATCLEQLLQALP